MSTTPADPNRPVRYWRPGDGVPGVVRLGVGLYLLCAVAMVLAGILMWTAEPPTYADPARQRTVDTVANLLRWIAVIEIVAAALLSVCVPGLLRGDSRRRFQALVVAGPAIFVALGSWVLGIGGLVQAFIALFLALAALAVYRPAVKTFYGTTTGGTR